MTISKKIAEAYVEVSTRYQKFARNLDTIRSRFSRFASQLKERAKTLSVIVGTALAAGLKVSIGKMMEQERAEARLRAAWRASHGQIGMTVKELKDLASALQKTTIFGDEQTMVAEGIMLTFHKIGKEVFPAAIKAAQDMSTMFGQDLTSSAIQLGTALNDPAEGMSRLRRIGVSFSKEQKDRIKTLLEENNVLGAQKIILGELAAEFGGAAEEMGKTAAGKMIRAKNAFGDVQESIGYLTESAIEGAWASTDLANAFESFAEKARSKTWLINAKMGLDAINNVVAKIMLGIKALWNMLTMKTGLSPMEAFLHPIKTWKNKGEIINNIRSQFDEIVKTFDEESKLLDQDLQKRADKLMEDMYGTGGQTTKTEREAARRLKEQAEKQVKKEKEVTDEKKKQTKELEKQKELLQDIAIVSTTELVNIAQEMIAKKVAAAAPTYAPPSAVAGMTKEHGDKLVGLLEGTNEKLEKLTHVAEKQAVVG